MLPATERSRDSVPSPGGKRRSHRRPPPLASIVGAAGLIFLAALSAVRVAPAQTSKPIVHVFLQLDVRSSVLERALQQQLPTLAVTVFSRYRDLEDAGAVKPDALVAMGPVLDQRGTQPALQGTRLGKDKEPYLLVSVGSVLDGSLSGKTIGAVDMMGREGTQSFVAALLKTDDIKVKRVAKSEDLLHLLEFSAADAILIPSSAFAFLAERTRLEIKRKEVPGDPVGLPSLAIFNAANKETIVRAFLGMDAETEKLLGIDAWRVR
jgi:hypothetical protein